MATKKTNLKVAEPKTDWCVDEAKIKEFSKKIVIGLSPHLPSWTT
jgi:hypothetical protein